MHSMGKTVTELHAMLKLHEQTLPPKEAAPALHAIRAGRIQKNQKKKSHKAAKGNQGKGKAKMGYAPVPAPPFAPKPKNPPTPKKDNPAKDAICHQCGEVGHWRRNCPIYLAELMKKKKLSQGASTSGIFTIELYSFPSTSWGLRGSRKLKPGALSLYVGDGHRATVEAIGEFHLCLPSGLVLILHNCHYAPSITRGIISVSRLYKDGFVNRFENDNSISVSRNNLIYFNAIPRDDIYEIVLSSSNTNDSSMYVVSNKRAKLNLDSALLWHCRLGHISKKRIEKLQHDGLLDSIGIKSLEKCVSCMFGNMVRKPYSHQVERAKDLLGLIHTDVCGPFKIMSRQGASYFVTFTDDFSRYGYVYLLKHKNEVFETFKEFLDHLKEHWIIAHGTPLYTPQHNEPSGSLEDLEIIQEEDMHPCLDTSLNHEVDDQEIDESQSDINPIHIRAIRILIAIAAFYDYEIWQIDVKTAFLNGYLNEETASRQWNKRFDNEIKKFGFSQNRDEPCVYVKASGNYVTFLILYVDDILIMGNNIPMLQDVKSYLGRCFAMKYLREAAYILRIKIYRDRSKRLIGLCQSAYIEKILKRFYMENSKRGTIPMQERLKLSDTKQELRVSCYTDVGYLTDADDLKSQTGYVFVLNGGAVDWKSTKQSIFATSSTDAEYIAAFDASKEAVWIRKFIYGLGVVPTIEEPINMYCDNTGAIAIAKDHGVTKGARHFRAKVHYL
ncbi:retrotransposon protein, putative, ty1-copia subclass [Tanacetum coccineum]